MGGKGRRGEKGRGVRNVRKNCLWQYLYKYRNISKYKLSFLYFYVLEPF